MIRPLSKAAMGAMSMASPAKPAAMGFMMSALVVLWSTSTTGRYE